MKKINKIFEKFEDIFLRYLLIICIVISIFSTFAYYFGFIKNVRGTMPNVIMFASIIFVVISLILTLLISLKGSLLFDRIRNKFPLVTKSVYKFLNKIILSSMVVVVLALFITVLPLNLNKYFKVFISLIGFIMFWYMILGAVYMLKFTTDMVVKNDNLQKTNKMQ
ncbi:hypothetical protein ACJDU8_04485 [Clostridium sp. WILCCON 0269]|uniref:DUF2975 domain-containing protein n=1 Tax=Candidatus Clostridium eludens TaxID=3381663 RepID=A0ABW8SG70_9CLOT